MMHVDLNRLRVFVAVYESESVVEAARQLHVTQPAVSQSLKKLEGELGVALFVRLHKKLVPTREGTALHHLFAPMLGHLEEGITALRRGQETPCGHLRVGAPVEFGQTLVPGLLGSFQQLYPEVTFALELGHPKRLLPRLKEGHLDVSFVDIFDHRWELEDALSLYHIEPLMEEELLLVGSSSYCKAHVPLWQKKPKQKDREEAIAQLAAAHYIAYAAHAPSLRSWWRHHVADEKIEMRLHLVVESVRAAMEAAACGMGLAIIPGHLLGSWKKGTLRAIPSLRGVPPQRNHISLAQLQDKVPTLTEKRFVSHCHEYIEATEGSPDAT